MPAVTSGKVLVTGATGFTAQWTIKKLLEEGYSVRGTVRSDDKIAKAKEPFVNYGDRIEMVVVEDMSEPEAFNTAVVGVDAIFHLATVTRFAHGDPTDLIHATVNGATGILASAAQEGGTVKRVIITSSGAAIHYPRSDFHVFTEEEWNDYSVNEVKEKGSEANISDKYRASKTLAERAVWNFMREHEKQVKFDLVVLNPTWIVGPLLVAPESPEQLNISMKFWWMGLRDESDDKIMRIASGEWIDVRDTALANVRAIQNEACGGHRIILSTGSYSLQDWIRAAHATDARLPAGDAAYDPTQATYEYRFDNSKASKLLKLDYTTLEKTTRDIVSQVKDKIDQGWVARVASSMRKM